jgi:hypothetical protein
MTHQPTQQEMTELCETIRTELAGRTDALRRLRVGPVVSDLVAAGAPRGWSVQLLDAETDLTCYVSSRAEWEQVKRELPMSHK